MSFCPSKNHYFTESLPNNQETSITLIKEDPFFLLKVMALPTILNPD